MLTSFNICSEHAIPEQTSKSNFEKLLLIYINDWMKKKSINDPGRKRNAILELPCVGSNCEKLL